MNRCEDAPFCGCCPPLDQYESSYDDYRENIDSDWWGSEDEMDYEDDE